MSSQRGLIIKTRKLSGERENRRAKSQLDLVLHLVQMKKGNQQKLNVITDYSQDTFENKTFLIRVLQIEIYISINSSALQRLIYWRAITFKVQISSPVSGIMRGSVQVKCIVLHFFLGSEMITYLKHQRNM